MFKHINEGVRFGLQIEKYKVWIGLISRLPLKYVINLFQTNAHFIKQN